MVVALKGKRRLYEPEDGPGDIARKIRAQRKFAQGVVVVSEEQRVQKKEKKKKKRADPHALSPSPTASPIKRPKTEDFLSFLCYRGTPVLPPDLDFFNFVPISTRSKDEPKATISSKAATKTAVLFQSGSKETPPLPKEKLPSSVTPSKDKDTKNKDVSKSSGSKSTPKKKVDKGDIGKKEKVDKGDTGKKEKVEKGDSGKKEKAEKGDTGKKEKVEKGDTAKKEKVEKGDSGKKEKVEKSDIGKKEKAEKINSSKMDKFDKPDTVRKEKADKMDTGKKERVKEIVTTEKSVKVPLKALVSPKLTRINEQEAQFAISALKLKYQEKRLSKLQAANKVVSKLTKKVKDRVILTRSKAKDDDRSSSIKTAITSRIKDNVDKKLPIVKRSVKQTQDSECRNIPSPDIIYGGRPKDRDEKKKSSSDSSSSDESPERNSPAENRKTMAKVLMRSLRRGRTYVLETKHTNKVKKRLVSHKVSTRASRRNGNSPLRELPMYGVRPKKNILSKMKPKKVVKKGMESRRESVDSESSLRPTRRTKENAAIYLGLLNKDFSSDENESDIDTRTKNRNDDDSSGNSSSSETKFLEKQYHACLKREKIKKKAAGRMSDKDKEKRLNLKAKVLEAARKKASKAAKVKQVRKRIPEKRILRSQSSRDAYASRQKKELNEEAARVTRRRVTVPLTPCDRPLAGAARKTASQVPKKNIQQSSSSSSSESASDDSDQSEDDDPPAKTLKVKESSLAEKSKTVKIVSSSSSSSEDQVNSESDEKESDSESEEEKDSMGPTPVRGPPETKFTKEKPETPITVSSRSSSSEAEADAEESETSSSDSDSSDSEEEVPVQKVSIAIQVDMDSEENTELELNEVYSHSNEEPIPVEPVQPAPAVEYLVDTGTGLVRGHGQEHQPGPSRPLLIPYSGPSYFPTLSAPMSTNTGLISQQHDFSLVFPTLNIPGMPGGLPMHNFAGQLSAYSSILSAQGPMCFSSTPATTSISAAATLQTHIRSVAANLDIPLVRPVVAVGTNSMLSVPLPVSRHHNIPLTRPQMHQIGAWLPDPRSPSQHHHQSSHYSAFRIPFTSAPPTSSSSRLYTSLATTRTSGLVMRQAQGHGQGPSHRSTFSQSQNPSKSQPPLIRPPAVNISRPKAKATGETSTQRTSQIQSQGMSLIQSLPNVSIVPRFDRNSKPISIPPEQGSSSESGTSALTSAKSKCKQQSKAKEPKKEKGTAGRKRKVSLIAAPTSPLTVRKDSTTPATYTGLLAKKQPKEKEPTTQSASTSKKSTSSDSFNKLLQSKTKAGDTGSERSTPCPSTSSSPCPSEPFERKDDEKQREQIPEVPAYYPTDEEFQDPLKYIERIQIGLEGVGMARIVPPRSFRPECNVEDDMRFTAYNHYIHRMHKRWGPNVHERMAILEHLRKSKVDVTIAPMIGGMEVDLATLFHTVQSFGGLKDVIEKHKWNKVSDAMHIPKAANDRATKLDAIYVKYVLPYEMLSENERKKLLAQVEEKWRCRENKNTSEDYSESESDEDDPFEEVEDCIIKGKSTPLSAYYRVARNTLSMIFRNREPTHTEVETNYWRQVQDKTRHLCVYSGSIDCAGVGWGFPLPKASMKHPWNLKVLANSSGSILRSMGPVMGATVPTLHVGMVFTSYCWYRDPQGLPWVEYLHSGGNKIWYVVPGSHENLFREVLSELMPGQCRNKKIWLLSDSAMVPLELLISRGVPVYRAVQSPGEFLVVFPSAFTSAICTGYVISESVSFALPKWLNTARQTFEDIRESKEPPVFPLEKLLMSIVGDVRVSSDVLRKALALAGPMVKEEIGWRKKLCDMGVSTGKMGAVHEKMPKASKKKEEKEVYECDSCNYILHFSVVINKTHEFVYCLPHAVKHLSKSKGHVKSSQLLLDNSDEQLMSTMESARSRLK